jgi:hypothetical protein
LIASNEEVEEEEVETSMRLSLMIEDQDGKALWSELFGLESFMIPWDKFLAGLKKILTDIKEDESKVLQWVLGMAHMSWLIGDYCSLG